MTADAVHVVGTRTFSAEVIDFAVDAGLEVAGLLEPFDRERVGTEVHELPVSWLDDGPRDGPVAVLLGTGEVDRRETVARLGAAGFQLATLIHPGAHVAPSARVDVGVVLGPGVVIGARSRIRKAVVVGRGSLIGHHTEIGSLSTLGPGANIAGNVSLGEGVFVGMGASVRDHVAVGTDAVIAMGAAVVSDVPTGARVMGIPARAAPGGPSG